MLKQTTIIEKKTKTENTVQGFLIKDNVKTSSLTLSRPKYPDLRFSCPNCGTLDVLINCQSFDFLKGMCLDCKMTWKETY